MKAPQSWPADRHPTAEEWVEWFLGSDHEGRLDIASQAIGSMVDINRCLASRDCWINR